jgi:hypothetical protein
MAMMPLIEYDEASAEIRAVYDDIMMTRGTNWINNFWRHWPTIRRPCGAPGRASRRSWRRARSIR